MKFVCFFIPFAENNSDVLDYDHISHGPITYTI
jgi:hypothetical protein